jgi:hypothetical protein
VTPDQLKALAEAATPGPWEPLFEDDREASVFSTSRDHGWVTPRPDKYTQARTGHECECTEGLTDADARLIALAPDLARLCAEMAELLRYPASADGEGDEFVKDCRSALARLSELGEPDFWRPDGKCVEC